MQNSVKRDQALAAARNALKAANLLDAVIRGDSPARAVDYIRDVERWCFHARSWLEQIQKEEQLSQAESFCGVE